MCHCIRRIKKCPNVQKRGNKDGKRSNGEDGWGEKLVTWTVHLGGVWGETSYRPTSTKEAEKDSLISSLWLPVLGPERMPWKCIMEGSDWVSGKGPSLRGLLDTGTGTPKQWSQQQNCLTSSSRQWSQGMQFDSWVIQYRNVESELDSTILVDLSQWYPSGYFRHSAGP